MIQRMLRSSMMRFGLDQTLILSQRQIESALSSWDGILKMMETAGISTCELPPGSRECEQGEHTKCKQCSCTCHPKKDGDERKIRTVI